MLHFQRWKLILTLGVVIAGVLFALPNLFPAATMARMPAWLPHKQINLGLDLQGGAHLLYQLDEKEMIDDWLATIRGDVRETLRKARVGYTDLAQNVATRQVTVKIRDAADMDKAFQELRKLAQPIGGNVFSGFNGYDMDVARQGDDGVSLTITDTGLTHRMGSAIQASIETIRRRVDAFGTTEPSIQREGRDRVLVQVPGIQDVERLKKLIGETGKLEFKLVDPSVNAAQVAQSKQVPIGDELVYGSPPSGSPQGSPQIPYVLKSQVLVTGQDLVDAQPGFDQRTGEPVVTFRFDAAGAKRFAMVTQENVGLPFAIVLDNKVVSAPVIREPILGGTGQISGNFSVQEANDLAVLLRSGALPAKLTVIEERTVGASLGADSIASGKKAALMGLALGDDLHVGRLRPVRHVRQHRAHLQCRADLRRALPHGRDAHAARHCRHRAHHRHRGGRQRADQRAHPRGDQGRKVSLCRCRCGLFASADHHHRLQRDDADRGAGSVLARLGTGARLRRDADGRHPRLDVHGRDGHALMVSYWLRWTRPQLIPI